MAGGGLRRRARTALDLVKRKGRRLSRLIRYLGVDPTSLACLQVAAVVALIPAAWLSSLLAGALLLTIALLRWTPTFSDIVVASRPLLLPTVLALLVAARDLPNGPRFVIGAAIAALMVPWAASNWSRTWDVVEATASGIWKGTLLLVVLLLLLIVGLALVFSIDSTRDSLGTTIEAAQDLGGMPILFTGVAALALVVAILARAAGFARSWARAVALVVLLGCAAIALVNAGLEEDDRHLEWVPDNLLLPGLVFFVLVAAAEAIIDLSRRPDVKFNSKVLSVAGVLTRKALHDRDGADARGPRDNKAYMAGLALTIASTVLLGFGMAYAYVETRQGATQEIVAEEVGVEARRAPLQLPADDAQLARRFAPVLAFSNKQRWAPQRYDSYARKARLAGAYRQGIPVEGGLPTECPPGAIDPCYRLECAAPESPCALTRDYSQERNRPRSATAYVRVVRRGREQPDRSPNPFDDRRAPLAEPVQALVQYWYFYPYDDWVAPVGPGLFVQRHAGDWEAVTVGLGKTRPLFVAYSQHCGGRWADWSRVQVAEDADRTHPLVAVAVGSHANYERASDARAPDWSTCNGIPGESVALLSYAWNLRDRTADDWRLRTDDLILVDADDPPMNFPGTWGADDRLELRIFGDRELHKGSGPRTPTRQALWQRPVHRIFCGEAWRGPRDGRSCSDESPPPAPELARQSQP